MFCNIFVICNKLINNVKITKKENLRESNFGPSLIKPKYGNTRVLLYTRVCLFGLCSPSSSPPRLPPHSYLSPSLIQLESVLSSQANWAAFASSILVNFAPPSLYCFQFSISQFWSWDLCCSFLSTESMKLDWSYECES